MKDNVFARNSVLLLKYLLLCWGILLCFLIIFIEPLSQWFFAVSDYRGEFLTKIILPTFAALVGGVGIILSVTRTNAIVEQTETLKETLENSKQELDVHKQEVAENSKFQEKELEQRIIDNREKIILSQFKDAVDHLSSQNLILSLSGIYELDKIAHESKEHIPLIFEIFCSYIRYNTNPQNRNTKEIDSDWVGFKYDEKVTFRPLITVQAIMKVLFSKENSIYQGLEANLSNSDLRKIDLVGLYFVNVKFDNAAMHAAAMYSKNESNQKTITEFKDCSFYRTYLQGANMSGARFENCTFYEANMCWANLSECELTRCNFEKSDLTGAILGGINTRMYRCNFNDACLDASEISRVFFVPDDCGHKNVFDRTTFRFASIFSTDWFYFDKTTLIHDVNITGAQNNEKYHFKTRIQRIIEYNYDAKSLELDWKLRVQDDDMCNRRMVYIQILKKISSYIIPNKMYEYDTPQDVEHDIRVLEEKCKAVQSGVAS